jgi:hypothetical protein
MPGNSSFKVSLRTSGIDVATCRKPKFTKAADSHRYGVLYLDLELVGNKGGCKHLSI